MNLLMFIQNLNSLRVSVIIIEEITVTLLKWLKSMIRFAKWFLKKKTISLKKKK
jgi:hypothetical protein